ncbi:SDR family NAD(P)-dependent oxidoreductase [Parasulfitobacter algicola]|uniref:SDR family oxidoreductase n=1 Tax=Parasulfitobacter algicola TaxID=2614809 RepID=A0ABX2ISG4_9RHOB|nr:SDR family oxidoreductase [Sulfitobacter algicola]NSX55848.1 SDR family oxidoreductase [Sulfitobacter algicola]
MTDASLRPIALITGASRGLGAALAEELAPTHHIVAVARTVGALEELDDRMRALGGEATLAPMDITVDAAMMQLCRSIFDRWGKVDLWCHTAIHAGPLSPSASLVEKDLDKSIAINARATGRLIPFVAPLLQAAENGQAVFFDDPRAGEKFFGYYGATKAAQIALARSWQAETVKTGPKVHIVTPDPMPTATRGRFFPGEDRSVLAAPKHQAKRLLSGII